MVVVVEEAVATVVAVEVLEVVAVVVTTDHSQTTSVLFRVTPDTSGVSAFIIRTRMLMRQDLGNSSQISKAVEDRKVQVAEANSFKDGRPPQIIIR